MHEWNGLAMGRWCSLPGGMMAVVVVIVVSMERPLGLLTKTLFWEIGAVSRTSVKQQFRSSEGDTQGFQQKVRLFFQLISVQFPTGKRKSGKLVQ